MAVDPVRAEAGLSELLALYRDAQRIIAMQVKEAIQDERIARRAFRIQAFRRVEEEIARLGAESEPLAKRLIENAWNEGDDSITKVLAKNGEHLVFNAINRDALIELQQALGTSLSDARQTVGRRVYDAYRRAGLQSTTLGMLGARGSGRAISQDLVERLKKQGIKSFTDRAGRQWDLRTYTEMVARTTTREAVVAAQVTRMGEQGIDLARVNNNGSSCSVCGPWEGTLVSLTGATPEYRGEPATAFSAMPNGGPPYHPRCRHFLQPEATDFEDYLRKQDGSGGAQPPAGGSGGGSGGSGTGGRKPPGGGDAGDIRSHLAKINKDVVLDRQTVHGGQLYSVRRLGSVVNSKKWHRQPLNDADRVIDDALKKAFGLVSPTTEEGVVWRAEPRGDRYSYEPHSPLPLFLGYLSTTAIREVAEDMLNELGGGDIWRLTVPPGLRPIDVNAMFGAAKPWEQEVLFETRHRFEVDTFERLPNGGRLVRVEIWHP